MPIIGFWYVFRLATVLLWCCNHRRDQTLERRADKQIVRQDDVLVRAVFRVWKAHERGRLMERVQNARLLRQTWEAWRRRVRHQRKLEGQCN